MDRYGTGIITDTSLFASKPAGGPTGPLPASDWVDTPDPGDQKGGFVRRQSPLNHVIGLVFFCLLRSKNNLQ